MAMAMAIINTTFYLVLNMSIISSVIAWLLLPLRFIKSLPRSVIYFLWSIVFIRLLIPFSFSSEISIMNFARAIVKRVVIVPEPAQKSVNLTALNVVKAAKKYFPITYKTSLLEGVFNVVTLIWICVACGAIILVIFLYYLSYREFKSIILIDGNVYSYKNVVSPIVHGFFKQKIIIPDSLKDNESELQYVRLHENVHIKRHDNLIRAIAMITACVHWFNPLVWIYLRIFIKDMEIACDSKAVSGLKSSERKKYAQTLIALSTNNERLLMGLGFGKDNLKVRILNILNYKKLTKFSMFFSLLFIITLVAVLLTNSVK
jgi:beta-lactamase regulating signal transducer with metallopeptidase domain